MKKVLALALALVMMFAVCVPAFAADKIITPDTLDGKESAVVKTRTTDINGDDAATFTVTIPAETVIPWGEENWDLVYTIDSQLAPQDRVFVEVTQDSTSMKNGALELPYSINGETNVATNAPVVSGDERTVEIHIAAADWADAAIAEYQDTLTFTAYVGQKAD